MNPVENCFERSDLDLVNITIDHLHCSSVLKVLADYLIELFMLLTAHVFLQQEVALGFAQEELAV